MNGKLTGFRILIARMPQTHGLLSEKKSSLDQKPQNALVQIAADSKYWLWINGELAVFEGGVKRGPTPQILITTKWIFLPF
jgi:hypothetical protein